MKPQSMVHLLCWGGLSEGLLPKTPLRKAPHLGRAPRNGGSSLE